MQTSPPSLDVESVMQRVRAELARRQGSEDVAAAFPTMTIAPASPLLSQPPAPTQYPQRVALADLLMFHDRDFIRQAYLAVLQRAPDPEGERTFLQRLREGALTKAEVLGRLRFSPEGRGKRVKIVGLLPAFVLQSASRMPVIGFLFSWLNWALRLPVLVRNFQTLEAHSHYAHAQFQQHIAAHTSELARLAQVQQRESGAAQSRYHVLQSESAARWAAAEAESARLLQALEAHLDAALADINARTDQRLDAQKQEMDVLARQLSDGVERLDLRLKQQSAEVEDALAAVRGRLDVLQIQLERLLASDGPLANRVSRAELAAAAAAQTAELASLRFSLEQIQHSIAARELQQVVARLRANEARDAREAELLEAFYLGFEDRFRGSRELVKARARHYLPLVLACDAGSPAAPVLDIGCGRGEWLELLGEHGRSALGIDINATMLQECRERGLQVQQADAVAYLRGVEPGSLGAITAIHVAEHLRFGELIELLDLCLRALRSGGLLALETPNPENVEVGSCNFYMDPTHGNPLPPALLEYLVASRGFQRAEVHRLTESRGELDPVPPLSSDSSNASELNSILFTLNHLVRVAPDYAVVAYKA
jgi:SAM-dependent methyltransferase